MPRKPGRPMRPIDNTRAGLGRLAAELRRGRSRQGMTRKQLAERVGCSVSTIQRAESSHSRPTWPVVLSIVGVCEVDLPTVEAMWKEARHEHGRTALTESPQLTLIRTPADLAASLRRVWQDNGEPSIREMERRAEARAKEFAPLSRSAANRIRRRKQQPTSLRQMYAYLTACQVPDQALPTWKQAWLRVQQYDKPADMPVYVPAKTAERHRLKSTEAALIMTGADLKPLDPFPGARNPWTAQCRRCRQISRFTLAGVKNGRTCPVCVIRRSA